MKVNIDWAYVERQAKKLQHTPIHDEHLVYIADEKELPDDELARQARIEQLYITLMFMRDGLADHTLEAVMLRFPDSFTKKELRIAKATLDSCKAFVEAERKS